MNSQTVNVSTGPVQISNQVQQAFAATPISHRSRDFGKMYKNTVDLLCTQFNVQKTYLITGSGTLANEVMLWQIKLTGGKGLILSNGEFGKRLVEQAERASLEFVEYELSWGMVFDLVTVENEIRKNDLKWVLFCHCETSTGVLNDLDCISKICSRNNCLCFVDCMSTVGTYALDLSRIAMATASSGKGLASIPGLAIVFSNIQASSSIQIPVYFDLAMYEEKEGIPFTISSNLLYALYVATQQKLQCNQFALAEHYSKLCGELLGEKKLLAFSEANSKVFTIAKTGLVITDVIDRLQRGNIIVSSESVYLKRRNFFQIALLGYYQEVQLIGLMKSLRKAFLCPYP